MGVELNKEDLKSILNDEKEDLNIFSGWRYEIFGKYVNLILEGKIAFTIKDNKLKKLEI